MELNEASENSCSKCSRTSGGWSCRSPDCGLPAWNAAEWAALRMHRAGASAAAAAGLAVVAVAPAPGSWGQPPNILLELSSGLLQRLEKGKSLEKK